MKRLIFIAMFLICTIAAAQEFDKGDSRIGLTAGVGTVFSGATFDQHFNMEWGIGKIADKVTIGIGFAINNMYGATDESYIAGTYDYHYTKYTYGSYFDKNYTQDIHREGTGYADCNISREDVNAQFTVSFHYSTVPGLDIYTKFGAGVGVMNYIVSNIHNENGFSSADKDSELPSGTTIRYSYNDLDHVKWKTAKPRVTPSVSIYGGATYYFNEHWGIDAQIGLISVNFKSKDKGYYESYSAFAIGFSYRF